MEEVLNHGFADCGKGVTDSIEGGGATKTIVRNIESLPDYHNKATNRFKRKGGKFI